MNPRNRAVFCAARLCGLVMVCQSAVAQPNASTGVIADQAFVKLGLVGGQVVDVLPVATAAGGLQVVVPVNGTPETIELNPVSVRSPDYTVLVQKEDGAYAQGEPTPEHNYRGSIIGMAESVVAATYDETGFRGKIHLPDGTRLWVEPLAGQVAAASPEQHIVYRDVDLLATQESCAEPIHAHDHVEPVEGAVAGRPGLYIAEIAIDADCEYFLDYGSVAAVEAQINTVINAMNVEYERDVLIRHVITRIIVRTAAADPYTSTDPQLLLLQFKSHWNNNQAAVHRDMAQLFTGKQLDGNVIGIAYLGEICTSSAYSVVQSDFNGAALAYQTDLSAHELGHNWNADHCSCSNPPYTMNPSITGANRFHPSASIPYIAAYRDTLACLDVGDELLRITIGSPATTFDVGQAAQLTATADFRFGADQDVTSDMNTTWTVDRPEFAFISSDGLLVLLAAEAESCVMVNASYTSDAITRTAQKQITVKDPTKTLALVSGNPPANSIDARRPSDPNGSNPTGWIIFDLTLNSEPCTLSPSRFTVTQAGGTQAVPVVTSVESLGGNVVRLTLNKAIDSGAWTTIDDTFSDVSIRVGFLPGDVSGNGTSTPSDILTLIDSLNGIVSLSDWSSDIDRSGLAAPADILTLIDLLNGAGGYAAWNGASLP
jgi:hypothetical protein